MGFTRAGQRSEYLSTYAGQLIGLQYVGILPNQTTKFPDGSEITRDIVRAKLIAFSDDGTKGNMEGECLVHQAVLASELSSRKSDWHLGVLTESALATDPTRTVFLLSPPEGDTNAIFSAAEKTVTERGWM